LRTVLSEVEVETSVVDRSFSELVRHELRWLRTIRAVRPLGYSSSLITFGVPVAALGSLLAGGAPAAAGMLAATCIARLGLHFKMRSHESPVLQLLILPLRDLLSLALWSWSFVTRRVDWRNAQYLISRDGVALPVVV
jgi:ceramide glucosyltransferase